MKRKLIEVSLPLEAINRGSVHEKPVPRRGHPATLHLWWARRPLAGARAILFAQLVDDPSARPDEFPTREARAAERARLHLPHLRDKNVLIRASEDVAIDIAWPQTGSALADDHDSATGEFRGLTVPIEDDRAVVTDDTYPVAPHVASAQRARERAATTDASSTVAESRASAPSVSTPTQLTSPPRSSSEDSSMVERARFEGRYEVDAAVPEAMTDEVREVSEEVVRHIVSAPGAENVSIVLEVSAENSEGLSEAVPRTVCENSRVLGFDKSDFEDLEW